MTISEFALRGRGLSFSFGGAPVLRGVDVDLPWGTVTAVAGPNGAGKSTLIEVLAGVRRPMAGELTRAGDVALVVQRVAVPDALPLTVQDVVAMGTWGASPSRSARAASPERRRRVSTALERVRLAGLAQVPFNSLSGGQRQRTLVAQGIARGAQIFLLDEPAAGLDAASRVRTHAILAEEARRGAAVACVSHDEDAIAAADRVVRLDAGRRVGQWEGAALGQKFLG